VYLDSEGVMKCEDHLASEAFCLPKSACKGA
jgi:hypothetical protein